MNIIFNKKIRDFGLIKLYDETDYLPSESILEDYRIHRIFLNTGLFESRHVNDGTYEVAVSISKMVLQDFQNLQNNSATKFVSAFYKNPEPVYTGWNYASLSDIRIAVLAHKKIIPKQYEQLNDQLKYHPIMLRIVFEQNEDVIAYVKNRKWFPSFTEEELIERFDCEFEHDEIVLTVNLNSTDLQRLLDDKHVEYLLESTIRHELSHATVQHIKIDVDGTNKLKSRLSVSIKKDEFKISRTKPEYFRNLRNLAYLLNPEEQHARYDETDTYARILLSRNEDEQYEENITTVRLNSISLKNNYPDEVIKTVAILKWNPLL